MGRRYWFGRTFDLGISVEAFPDLIERLRGTPARLEERVAGLSVEDLTGRPGGSWSIQEHVGHLLDLEDLWLARLDDFAAGRTGLAAADLENRKTHEAGHNEAALVDLLESFRRVRLGMVGRLEGLSDPDRMATAQHPRLEQPMTVVDRMFFVAEHDDHHLAGITELRRGPS